MTRYFLTLSQADRHFCSQLYKSDVFTGFTIGKCLLFDKFIFNKEKHNLDSHCSAGLFKGCCANYYN